MTDEQIYDCFKTSSAFSNQNPSLKITSNATWFLWMHVNIDGKKPIFFLSLSVLAYFSASPIGHIYWNYILKKKHDNNSRSSKFGENRTEVRNILHKELNSFQSLRRNHFRNIPLYKGSGIRFAMFASDV